MLKDKIAEILENYRDDVVTTNERGTIKDQKVILNQATLAILTAFREALPKEKELWIDASINCQRMNSNEDQETQDKYFEGYNLCLSDILKTIGGVE